MAIKNVAFVCYEESCNIEEALKKRSDNISQYAYILHDKDLDENNQPKKNHYHVIIRYLKETTKNQIANDFNISPSLVQKLGNMAGNIAYMLHKDLNDKYQYDVSEIVSYRIDISEVLKDYTNVGLSDSRIIELIIDKFAQGCNRYEVLNFVIKNGYIDVYKKYYSIIRDICFSMK